MLTRTFSSRSRGRNQTAISRWLALSESTAGLLYSAVSAAELWAGVRDSEQEQLTYLLSQLVCVSVDEVVGRKAGEYLRKFHKSHSLEVADALIAASAVTSGASLWTRNRKHYPMEDLTLYESSGS